MTTSRAISTTLLLAVLATSLAMTPALPAVAPAATGLGFWAALGCMGCIGGFVVGGGLTVVGLAVFLSLNPELAIACVAACNLAY